MIVGGIRLALERVISGIKFLLVIHRAITNASRVSAFSGNDYIESGG